MSKPPAPHASAAPADRVRRARLTIGLARDLQGFLESCESGLTGAAATPAAPDLARWCRDLRGSLETLLFQQETMILSLHVPLATPPGFRQLLADVQGEGFFACYHEITDCHGQVVTDYPPAARCIHGHFQVARLRARYAGARLLTWVMDPVHRVAAHYHYWQREPDWQNPLCQALHRQRWSLLQFARQREARDETARLFGDLRPADFTFLGLLEEFPRSVDLLMHRLRVTAVPVFQTYRRSAANIAFEPLPPAEAEEIASLNRRSCRLYADCHEWFQQACRAAGV